MLAALLLAVVTAACTDDKTESQVTLHYMDIGDIGPSMHYTSEAPTFKGATPSEFAVEAVKLDGEMYADNDACFTINAATGSIIIANTVNLLPGMYSLSISCMAGGQRNFFADIVKVKMLSATPLEVEVTPAVLEIAYDGAKTSKLTSQITPKDEAVTISSYELVQAEGKEYFTVSKTGKIGINAAYKDEILPGVYTPGLKLASLAGSAVYENTFTIKITSKPLEVAYKPVQGRSEYALAFTSPVPTVKGSIEDGLQWAIADVEPQTDKFTIDPATGVISLAADNGLAIDDVYTFDLTVANTYGSTDFSAAYAIKIVAFITPIDPAKFAYEAAEAVEACAFTVAKKADFVGDEVTFELGTLPAALMGQLTIDDETGEVSAVKGNTIPVGDYQIPVIATNTKGTATATLALKVKANPNMFHKFGYGNNLGLDAESNADQFRYEPTVGKDLKVTIPVGYNDFNGRSVKFELAAIHNNPIRTPLSTNFTIDDAGTVSILFRNDRDGQIGVFSVTATIGEGETAVSRKTIVFIKVSPDIDKGIIYTPFVFRVNPRTGGQSVAPTFAPGVDRSKVFISLKRNVFYYNIDGPATHINGQLAAGASTLFVYKMWGNYFAPAAVNAGSREPFTYYTMTDSSPAANLSSKLGYIDPSNDFKVVVNPNKWVDADNKAANGVFIFQAPYSTTGDYSAIDASGTKSFTYPVAVWFDEKF